MKINSPRKTSKKVLALIIIAVALVGLISYGVYAKLNSTWPFKDTESSQKGSDETNTADKNDQADKSKKSSDTKSTTNSPKTPVKNEPVTEDTPANSIPVTITSIDQIDDNLRIRTLVEKITNSGTCELTLTKQSAKVSKSSGIQALPSSSTCKGFSVPLSELSKGTWTISLKVSVGTKTGTTSQTTEIQ